MPEVKCSYVWMEVYMKLASAALVSAPWALILSMESTGNADEHEMTCRECLPSAGKPEVVGSKDGFWLSVAILLGMALVVGIARPFARPQVNALQTSCFVCALTVQNLNAVEDVFCHAHWFSCRPF